ncbi:YcxB family protein [Streptomyces sp. NPDC059071]|uniref:YcxB family protein n=1 Tax=unclassified Streptomyces TaxID=2593676 RepID=UPI0036653A56
MTTELELVYTPTREDIVDAVRVQMRQGAFRVLRWLLPVAAVMAFLAVALMLTRPGEPEIGRAILLGGLGVFVIVLPSLSVRLTARQVYAMVERQGEHRVRVDEDGMRWETRDSELVSRWQLTPRYTETPTQFVLLCGDKGRAGACGLPKRGLADPADVDRLRALLDRNLDRL